MVLSKAVAVVVFVLSAVSFTCEAFAEEPASILQQESGRSAACKGDGAQKKLQFLDENGDGLNDLVRDSDGDGVPDGRICNGSGYGVGRGAAYWQGGGGAGNGGSGRGYGSGFRQGRGRR